jgi:hypothetical protein
MEQLFQMELVMQLLLVPLWGKEGSATATVIGQLLVPLYILFLGQKIYFVPYPLRTAFLNTAIPVALGSLFRIFIFDYSETYTQFMVKLGVLLAYCSIWIYTYRSKVIQAISSIKKERV